MTLFWCIENLRDPIRGPTSKSLLPKQRCVCNTSCLVLHLLTCTTLRDQYGFKKGDLTPRMIGLPHALIILQVRLHSKNHASSVGEREVQDDQAVKEDLYQWRSRLRLDG